MNTKKSNSMIMITIFIWVPGLVGLYIYRKMKYGLRLWRWERGDHICAVASKEVSCRSKILSKYFIMLLKYFFLDIYAKSILIEWMWFEYEIKNIFYSHLLRYTQCSICIFGFSFRILFWMWKIRTKSWKINDYNLQYNEI